MANEKKQNGNTQSEPVGSTLSQFSGSGGKGGSGGNGGICLEALLVISGVVIYSTWKIVIMFS